MASAIMCNCSRFRDRRERRRTREGLALEADKPLELGAVGEWVQRTCGGGRGAQQDFGVSASVQLPLVASAVSASSWRFSKSRTGNLHRADTSAAVEHPEILAVREGIQRPCGSEQSKYRQMCQGVQVSDGLGGLQCKFKDALAL